MTDHAVDTEAVVAVVESLVLTLVEIGVLSVDQVIAMTEDVSALYRSRAAAETAGSPAARFNEAVALRVEDLFRYANLKAVDAAGEGSQATVRASKARCDRS